MQARIDRMQRLLDATVEVADQYGNNVLNSLIAEMKKELETFENLLQLIEDY